MRERLAGRADGPPAPSTPGGPAEDVLEDESEPIVIYEKTRAWFIIRNSFLSIFFIFGLAVVVFTEDVEWYVIIVLLIFMLLSANILTFCIRRAVARMTDGNPLVIGENFIQWRGRRVDREDIELVGHRTTKHGFLGLKWLGSLLNFFGISFDVLEIRTASETTRVPMKLYFHDETLRSDVINHIMDMVESGADL